MKFPTRRNVLVGGAAAALLTSGTGRAFAIAASVEAHGMSSFGDLKYPADFKHFDYVNPSAPKGGTLAIQIRQTTGNQNFDTFNTLNVFVLRGDGAAGIPATFDTLMVGSGDEPDAVYGLVAKSAEVSEDKLTYRFRLRPEARFHDGSPLGAKDVAFSLKILKDKGHPVFRSILTQMVAAEAEAEDLLVVRFSPQRSRDLHLVVAGMPIFSERYWQGRDFEAATLDAPLGSGPYKVGRFETGRFIELDRVPDYWAKDLPVNVGQNNFDRIRYEYFRDRTVAFEAFKNGTLNFQEEFTSRTWATGYDFPSLREGRVKKETIPNDSPAPIQGWYFNTRREAFKDPRIREAIGLAFDFEWTNANIMYGSYKRLTSYFENTDMKAEGRPRPKKLALLDPFRNRFRRKSSANPSCPPSRTVPVRTDGSCGGPTNFAGSRMQARGRGSQAPERPAVHDRIPRLSERPAAPHAALSGQPRRSSASRPARVSSMRLNISGAWTSTISTWRAARSRRRDAGRQPARRLWVAGREVAGQPQHRGHRRPGGRCPGGADRAVAKTRKELVVACRALDRVLRAGHYWVPMWYKGNDWLAYWDEFDRPAVKPELDSGAPGTWWHDPEKAKRIGRG